MRFCYLSHCLATKAHQSLCCSHTQSMGVDEDFDQNLDLTLLDTSACVFNGDFRHMR